MSERAAPPSTTPTTRWRPNGTSTRLPGAGGSPPPAGAR